MRFYRARGARADLRGSAMFEHTHTKTCVSAGSASHAQCSVGGYSVAQWMILGGIISTY